ncbi:branched-chain-amino-acid aminotransferase-like protein 1 [Anneissia japonica]|uniref:branched-chain-amino-acid aminotransferase-like protein 1 n=1 Tax=Anneissia japonica TaxID=1529436 RepID=UPI00142554D3|nr:branched-chain-amino-acid aminotransferase-like protein 1 [Anneissia japonica]
MANNNKLVRVMMWSAPRSMSTAIERSILTLEDAEVFNEMYCAVQHFGSCSSHFPIRLSPYFSYQWVKDELEKNYPGKNVVFGKDFAYALDGDYRYLPKGFTHTILIRNPNSVFNSIKRVIKNSFLLRWFSNRIETHFPDTLLFKHLWDLYTHARDNLQQTPIVIDADDFAKNPEAMMQLYCHKTGIPFRKSMLKWKPTNIWSINWHCSYALSFAGWCLGYYTSLLSSSGFWQSKKTDDFVEFDATDDEARRLASENMKYYDMLYANRLVLHDQYL